MRNSPSLSASLFSYSTSAFIACASDLDWAPGYFPAKIEITDPKDAACATMHFDRTSLTDEGATYRRCDEGVSGPRSVTIFND